MESCQQRVARREGKVVLQLSRQEAKGVAQGVAKSIKQSKIASRFSSLHRLAVFFPAA